MDRKYVVVVGDDEFQVTAGGNQAARYKASRLFKSKYRLDCSLNKIAYFAIASQSPEPEFTSGKVLAILARMEEVLV